MGNLIAYFNNNKAGSVQHPFKTPLKLLHLEIHQLHQEI